MANCQFNEITSLSDISFFAHGCRLLVLPVARVLFVLFGDDVVGHDLQ